MIFHFMAAYTMAAASQSHFLKKARETAETGRIYQSD
jgi:hypothetical protein